MKKTQNKGFTLGELLVVVAIIAVLVSIALPIFSLQFEKSKENQDISNMKDAYALMEAYTLTNKKIDGKSAKEYTVGNPAYFDGSDDITKNLPDPYGKGTSRDGGTESYSACSDYSYDNTKDYTKSVIKVWFENNTVHVHWVALSDSNTTEDGIKYVVIDGKNIQVRQAPNIAGKENATPESITAGYVYEYNGSYYVSLQSPNPFTQYYCPLPDTEAGSSYYIKPTGTYISSSSVNASGNITVSVHVGDIYNDGTNLYIRKYYDDTSGAAQTPSQNTGLWQIIN